MQDVRRASLRVIPARPLLGCPANHRLFSLPRDKLMKIPAFLWAFTKFRQAKAWLEATEAWQAISAISKAARQYVTEMRKSAAVAFRQS